MRSFDARHIQGNRSTSNASGRSSAMAILNYVLLGGVSAMPQALGKLGRVNWAGTTAVRQLSAVGGGGARRLPCSLHSRAVLRGGAGRCSTGGRGGLRREQMRAGPHPPPPNVHPQSRRNSRHGRRCCVAARDAQHHGVPHHPAAESGDFRSRSQDSRIQSCIAFHGKIAQCLMACLEGASIVLEYRMADRCRLSAAGYQPRSRQG